MKKIVCELCEGTDFVKDGGMFVCQGCGTKYTAEEAKSMMREVEGATPVSGGAPAMSAPMGNSNQQQIENLLVLAANAFESGNNKETEGYCNKVIELDVTCYKAWLLKGQAIGWQSTYGRPRVEEGANAMRKAVDFAPEEEKDSVARQAITAICRICTAIHSLAKENFSTSPTEDNREKFFTFCEMCGNATDLFNNVSPEIEQFGFDEWKAQKRMMAMLMNQAGVAATAFVREKWNDIDHPNDNSFSTYLDWFGEIDSIFQNAIENGIAADEDDDDIITRYKNRIVALEEPIGKCSWDRVWNSWSSSYEWTRSKGLADAAVANRKKQVSECKNAIKKIKNKVKEKAAAEKKAAEEAKKARIAAYWEAHADEKAKLDAEKKELADKKSKLNAEIADLTKQINATQPTGKVPSEEESDKISLQIVQLNEQKSKLGLFSGKEKKRIGEEIASLQGRVDSLKSKIEEEKKARAAEADKKAAPLKAKKDELEKQVSAANKRLSAIEAELTKDPEA